MNIEITLNNVQHVKELNFNLNAEDGRLVCLVGKNSVGKTTLLRAVRNIYLNNTFIETAAPYIFNEHSLLKYKFDDTEISFTYNKRLQSVDTKQLIPDDIRNLFLVELPIPHGERFNQFKRLSDLDEEIRAKIALSQYSTPELLIEFLNAVYLDERFVNLKEVNIKGKSYYFILKDDNDRFYIREDYFSSGEYFVINLYRSILSEKKFIFIDEIDISLDSSAQVNLLKALRGACSKYGSTVIFTTHSLALMKTLSCEELFYIEKGDNNNITITNRSYEFVKSVLYGFKGYDRYILTEDKCLEDYIRYVIGKHENLFFSHQVIYIGGGSQVVDLLHRNKINEFLSNDDNIMALLDGDQKDKPYHRGLSNVFFLPFSNIEMEIYSRYLAGDPALPKVDHIDGNKVPKRAKNLFWQLTKVHGNQQKVTKEYLFKHLEDLFPEEMKSLGETIVRFLSPK
ncbi:AAA family ATPase [Vibrio cholerae]|uniref:AAA family ATPase n=1 Tax=Vibrio cholerae TaxID=666 RepID=UPI000BA9A9F7|nr:AAA family ATPase [Vibrio cholerae]EGR1444981.1 ATP-binding cassette domain-containing protein [Vibrio cholerae]EGR4152771.1 ATP-binding cassette domain-containing protein [Vibrio cholerae]PAR79508.1 spermidine/putrescine ABC transporter ATP-binding protein [Vibrio cholerae]GHX79837.1 putative ATP binding protein [Vibrio cholerae]